MRSLFAGGGFEFEIRRSGIPAPGYGEVLVKVKACGLCGTDIHYSKDSRNGFIPLGHEISGQIVELGKEVTDHKVGDMVVVEDISACGECGECKNGYPHKCKNGPDMNGQAGMSDYITVNHRQLISFDGMDYISASLTEPCAVSINCAANAKIPFGGSVVVMGPGPVGLMCIKISRLMGASKVVLVGTTYKNKREAARFEVGKLMGADTVIEAEETDAAEAVREYLKGGADSIIVTSPPETVPGAVKMAKYGGTVMFSGLDLGGKDRIELSINDLIFNKISLIPTFAEPALRFPDAVKLISSGAIDAGKLITHTFSFDEAADIIRKSSSGEEGIIKAVLLPELQ
jgi:L-iditol 2-dehydrogenase